jgi:hypothetical protein
VPRAARQVAARAIPIAMAHLPRVGCRVARFQGVGEGIDLEDALKYLAFLP